MSKLIDELVRMMSELTAVADAIRANDRFLLVTHENPDGDALGSILGDEARARRARQGQRHVRRRRDGAAARLRRSWRSTTCAASCRTTRPRGSCSRSTARPRRGRGVPPEVLEAAPLVIDVDHHHDNTRFGAINLVVADASSTGEIVRDLLRELGVDADAGDRRGDLRRARHRHRPLPVREHDAEGARARGAS